MFWTQSVRELNSPVPASSSEGAWDHLPTTVVIENAEEEMEEML